MPAIRLCATTESPKRSVIIVEQTTHKIKITGVVILALLAGCVQGTPTPNYTPTATNTPPLITPTITPTPLPTSTPTPALQDYNINLFFDKNLSGEMYYEGEIPLESVDLEARIGEDVFSCTSDAQGDCALQLPIGFSGSLEVRFPNKVFNPQNNHELKIAVLNFGQETVQIPTELKSTLGMTAYLKFGMTAYIRNKIDLFKTSLPFMLPTKDIKAIGLSHGEATYWVPGFDMENTCIHNYLDLDVNWGTNENYSGDKRMSTSIKDICASQYGTKAQHPGIDTAYLPGSPRIVVSPALGIVTTVGQSGINRGFTMFTKLGNSIGIAHMVGIWAVQEGQIIYPGDIIGIGGAISGDSPRHVHVEYHLFLPYYGKTTPNRPYEDAYTEIIGSHFETQPSIEWIHENYDSFSDELFPWMANVGSTIDFFWYEPQWNPPDQSMLREGDRCVYFGVNEGYCIMHYRNMGANQNHFLHPSNGTFAAGNELVPPEIEAIR